MKGPISQSVFSFLGEMFLLALLGSGLPISYALASEDDPSPQFVPNSQCTACHGQQGTEWKGSHHAQSMLPATKESVKGDFSGIKFTHFDTTSTFFLANGEYFVNTVGPTGELTDYKIRYTFGVDPLQQYIVQLDNGHLQVLTTAWDTRAAAEGGQKWFQLAPEEITLPGDPLHWTGRAYNWNNRCAECHSTNVEKNYKLYFDAYRTTWSEINVSCQSCHGPGEAHIQWTKLPDSRQKAQSDKGLFVDYASNGSSYQVDTCARCHSRRHPVSSSDKHGRTFLDDFMPATLSEGLYHPDGQINDEVFVYGSFLQSKMYANGVGCIDCHNPHSGELKLAGNQLCLQCHQNSPLARFPSLQLKLFDTPAHHFHKQGSSGSLCVNCHMPAKVYMEVDPRRDHSFKIPNPALSQKIGTPNVCTSCHEDKTVPWAVAKMEQWYGKRDLSTQDPAEIIHAARQGEAAALQGLAGLIRNPQTQPILVATAIEQLGQYFPEREAVELLIESLQHANPLIRATAASNLDRFPIKYRLPLVTPLLDDPIRAVRIQAARVAAAIPVSAFKDKKDSLDAALQEYIDLQRALADTPEAHVNLGVLYTDQQQFTLAEHEYKQAIRLAPEFVPGHVNLANLYHRLGRGEAAEAEFREAIEIMPNAGELHYSLGLHLAEQQRYVDAAKSLAKATQLLPERQRVAYNYALTLQQTGQYNEAETVLKKTHAASPDDPDIVYALVTLYAQQNKWTLALPFAKLLVEITQGADGPAKIYAQIQEKVQ